MINRAINKRSKQEILQALNPLLAEWFDSRFTDLTEPQSLAIPIIEGRKNVLISSPTGSGKTLTAFLSILDRLYKLQKKGELEDRIYAIYVSPLKALANDINKNLLAPLRELGELARSKGMPEPRIRVAVRTGDTSSSERQRQAVKSPHIFITTPESLSLVLSTPKFRMKFSRAEYVIVDEIHEICDSKRGVALSLNLERLQAAVPYELARIGLSATQAPIEEIGKFLVGHDGADWRELTIAEVGRQKDLDLSVLCPADDMTALPFEIVNSKMYDLLSKMISEHRTTLIFTNTRSGTEQVVFKLKERGITDIAAHHGSMSKESRIAVEDDLKDGNLKSVVSSTSLELGIDIGYIDLVCQIGSPKTVAKGLQRVGRAGHAYGKTSKGRMIVFDNDDLIECAVLCRAAHSNHVDRVSIPSLSLDVLSQMLVGMSLERKWSVDEAYEVVRRSYCYRKLTKEQFASVIRYLAAKDDFKGVYPKIWYDENEEVFGMKRGSRLIYYLNQGTIPEESSYKVLSEKGAIIGELSEKFVERLSRGDIFVLGGRSYEFIRTRGMKVFVKPAMGRKPTVPSWTGEMLPRSFDLSVEIASFRGEMDERLDRFSEAENMTWLREEFGIDEGSARTILYYFVEQRAVLGVPTNERLLIEGFTDEEGKANIIFHYPFGRRVNDALSRGYAFTIANLYGFNTTVSITDDAFMITAPSQIPLDKLPRLLRSEDIESLLRSSLRDTELLSQRFRHCATRSFMILKNYRGRELSLSRQQTRSQRLMSVLRDVEDFPVISETYSEILNEVFDIEHAREVLVSIEEGERAVETIGYTDALSPFAHNVLLAGISDVVLMEDRSSLLRQLHRKVLSKVLGAEALSEYKFSDEKVEAHFQSKLVEVNNEEDLLELLHKTGPIHLFRDKGLNLSSLLGIRIEDARKMATRLLREGKIRSVWLSDSHWVFAEDRDEISVALGAKVEQTGLGGRILKFIATPKTLSKIAQNFSISREEAREELNLLERCFFAEKTSFSRNSFSWKAADPAYGDREHARAMIIGRHLSMFAPLTTEEIAYYFRLDEEDVSDSLSALEADGKVVSGRFVLGDDIQYMLANDYMSLSNEGREVFDEETVRKYQLWKQFQGVEGVDDFFDRFGEAGMLCDIHQRMPISDLDNWIRQRSSGRILCGRFLRGKVRYVRAEEAPYYMALYREYDPNDFDESVMRKIDEIGGATIFDLEKELGVERERVRESLELLDQNVYIVRDYSDGEDWSGLNIYRVFEPEREESREAAAEWIVRKYLSGHGPVSLHSIKSYTSLEVEEIIAALEKLKATKILVGLTGIELFALEEDVENLRSFRAGSDGMRVMSLYDPFLETRRAELMSRFGEGWYFPIVKDGLIVGMTEIWPLSSCIEVRELSLDEPSDELFAEFLGAIDYFASLFTLFGIDLIRIRAAFGVDADEMDENKMAVLRRAGYRSINGQLVKGEVIDSIFDEEAILSGILTRQHLIETKQYANLSTALRSMGGLRNEFEGLARSKQVKGDTRLTKMKGVYRGIGIPPHMMYMTLPQAATYRAAKEAELDEDMETIRKVLSSNRPLTKDRILELAPLGPTAATNALRKLYQKTYAVIDSHKNYRAVGDAEFSSPEARKQVVKKAFEMFGIFSAEGLSHYLRHSFGMRDLRKALRSLEEDRYLKKGYIRKDDETLYWVIASDLPKMKKTRFRDAFILSPQDRLATYIRDVWKLRYGETDQYIIFDGIECVGKFRGRMERNEIEVRDFEGNERAAEILKEFSQRIGRSVQREDEKRLSEWEIADFFERTHMFARDK